MKNFVKLLGIIALVAIMGFSFVACGDGDGPGGPGGPGGGGGGGGSGGGSGGGGGGGGGSGLVGKWYTDKQTADGVAAGLGYSQNDYINLYMAGKLPDGAVIDLAAYEFKSNGKIIAGGSVEYNYSATSNTITVIYEGFKAVPANYSISGKTLTLDAPEGSGLTTGTYYKAR